MMNYSIGFIGTGNMTKAFLSGLIEGVSDIEKNIFVTDALKEKAEEVCKEFNVNLSSNNIDLVKKSSIIFLAVKPYIYETVLNELKDHITEKHIIISIAAGISIGFMEDILTKPVKIIRTMPNTPLLVGEGMTALTYNKFVEDNELTYVLDIFSRVGKVEIIDEKLMDVATAVSGSSPAIVYAFIEALADGGVLQGMPRDKAYKFAAQAVLGGAKVVLESGMHPGLLKDMVCTPGGTTIEAMYTLEKNSFRGTVMEAVNSCAKKARTLTK